MEGTDTLIKVFGVTCKIFEGSTLVAYMLRNVTFDNCQQDTICQYKYLCKVNDSLRYAI